MSTKYLQKAYEIGNKFKSNRLLRITEREHAILEMKKGSYELALQYALKGEIPGSRVAVDNQ